MPFDTLAMAAVADELRDVIVGGQIQRIIQPSAPSVSLAIYAGGRQHWLVLSADAVYSRAHLSSERLAKGFPTPSSFVMLLRKHLEGSRVVDVYQQPYERVLHLVCGTDVHRVVLVIEVMGKHSNIILLDADQTILGAIKFVPMRQSRVRPIVPGLRYTPPPPRDRDTELFPAGARVDPNISPHTFVEILQRAPARAPLRTALMGLLPGVGPFLVDEIAARSGLEGEVVVLDAPLERVRTAAADVYRLYQTRNWEPFTFTGSRNRMDFAPFRPFHRPGAAPIESISAAVEDTMGRGENRDSLMVQRNALLAQVDRAIHATEQRETSLLEGLRASEDAERVMERGQLVLAYQHLLGPRAAELAIPDLGLTIQLDPAMTAAENAERAFRRYRKLRDARTRIPHLLESTRTELARLQDLATFARLAESEAELKDLERFVTRPDAVEPATRPKVEKRRGPARYTLAGNLLLVGRNAVQNEEVTFRLAGREDIWLHARQRTGAHVILRPGGDAPTNDVLEAAAGVAAYFSEGRSDTAVDVDVARVRDVRKIPGGPPGRVTYRGERTIRTAPSLGEWVAERRSTQSRGTAKHS